jgi:hypothetical protein
MPNRGDEIIRKALVCCLVLWSTGASAQDKVGAYVGGSFGQFFYQEEGVGDPLIDDTAPSLKVYGGYRFNEILAVEGAYGQTDEMSAYRREPLSPRTDASLTVRAEYELLEVRGLAHVKSFFAGIGYWAANPNGHRDAATFSPGGSAGPSSSVPVSDTDSGVSLVLGGQWDLGDVGVRIEVEAYDMDETKSVGGGTLDTVDHGNNFSFGVHYRF